jgi:hypothetical protein
MARDLMTPEQFIRKWTASTLSEKSAAQQHFLDLCALLGELPPAEADPTGETFTFEKGGTTVTGGHGWADVWRKGAFAWEYKGPGKDLNAAYSQLKKYADMLENPPLLITCDTKRIEIHTNFTNTVKALHELELEDLADPEKRQLLKNAFSSPERLRPGVTRQMVTKEAAERFSELAHELQGKGYDPHRIAHFLNRIIFCMFAEDVGLLPNRLFSKLATASVAHPEQFEANAKQLFASMATGGTVAFEVVDWFNGGLFDDDATLPLDDVSLKFVLKCSELDWSSIEPSIFGTLFERGLDPDKRAQQGAHYTDPDTIMKIVGPVVLEPWEREWEQEKATLAKLAGKAAKAISAAAHKRYVSFLERLHQFRVLDPACGSGNFLYLALRGLKDFEKRVIHEAETLGLPVQFPRVGPEAVLGIEVNAYAAELARVTIWIGELQWMIENGFGAAKNPILKPLNQIECRDAILNEDGTEPEWPPADAIVGNPPFLGGAKLIRELGESYTQLLRAAYRGSPPAGADLVTYWFEKARKAVASEVTSFVGLVATNSITGPINRSVLSAIQSDARIFSAWSDEPWINEGAAVRVSLICFDSRTNARVGCVLDGVSVKGIDAELRPIETGTDERIAPTVATLPSNLGVAFRGMTKNGSFDVPGNLARRWLSMTNPHGRPNSDVVRPWRNGRDIAQRTRDMWIVDFGVDRSETDASLFEEPFAAIAKVVKEERAGNRRDAYRARWWIFGEARPGLRQAITSMSRYIATPQTSTHGVFVWIDSAVVPDQQLIVFARDDYTSFGLLHSHAHRIWHLKMCSWLGVGNDPRYTPTTVFETFPFPDGLSPNICAADYAMDPRAARISKVAKRLDELRENWLNPPELVERVPEVVPKYPDRLMPKSPEAEKVLRKRTLTKLYNEKPAWLQHAHRELDEAVAAAYGWGWPLEDEEILKRLFELNQERIVAVTHREAEVGS